MGNDFEDYEEVEEDESNYNTEQTGMDKFMNFAKENKKLLIVGACVIFILIIMALMPKNEDNIKINKEELTVTVDASEKLEILEDDKPVSEVDWMSKQESIATVDKDGTVKGISVGEATIVGTYKEKDYECTVTVSEGDPKIKVEQVTISENGTILMSVGDTYQVPIQITPNEAKVNNKVFSSSNQSVASIDEIEGIITAKTSGTATITVLVNSGEKMATIQLMVMDGPVTAGIYVIPTKLTLNEKNITMVEGETKNLTYTQEPNDAITDYVIWTSSNEEIASIYNGELVAKMPGDVEISVTSVGLKDSTMVHIKKGTVDVTGIRLYTAENLTMKVGEKKKIVASVDPTDATNKVITYSASNPSVVSVDTDGVVEAVGSGSSSITIASGSNPEINKTVYVTVDEQKTPTPTPEEKVGTVSIVGTNNAVSTTDGGTAVEKTTITMTGSGNVDEIRYCYYNKASSSTCSPSNIYTYDFELPSGTVNITTTYVIKAAPYYKNKKGTEVTRYVKIKPGSQSQPTTKGYDVTSGNLYNNQGTANNYHKTGNQTVKFDIRSSNTAYLKVCKGIGCTPLTRVNDNGTFTVTGTGMITVRVSEYNSSGALLRGPDTWYVYIDAPVQTSKCYCTTSGTCRWGVSGSGYTVLANVDETSCKRYINSSNQGCFAKSGKKFWGSYMGNPTEYAYISTITSASACSACYVSATSQGTGSNFTWTNNPSSSNLVEAKALNTPVKCNSAKAGKLCFKDSSGNYHWGSNYSVNASYTYDSTKTTPSACELSAAKVNEIGKRVSKTNGNLHYYCTSTPASACQGDVTWTSSDNSVVRFIDNKKGIAKLEGIGTNFRIAVTLANGKTGYVDYTAPPPFPYYRRELKTSYMTYYEGAGSGNDYYPIIAFDNLVAPTEHNGIMMCYYVRNNGTPTASEIKSKCNFAGSSATIITPKNKTIASGGVALFQIMKLQDQAKIYEAYGSTFAINRVFQAFEFGYVSDSELRHSGSSSENIILVLSPFYRTENYNAVVSNDFVSVYKIKIGSVRSYCGESTYSYWTIDDLTYSLYGDSYTN